MFWDTKAYDIKELRKGSPQKLKISANLVRVVCVTSKMYLPVGIANSVRSYDVKKDIPIFEEDLIILTRI